MWGCSEMHSRNNPSAESHLGIPRMLSMRFIICLIGMSNYFRKISMIEGFHHLRTANVKYRYIHPLLYSVTTARATTLSTSTTLNSKDPNISITDMNLVELKVLLKQLGGSPGTLRKADILALCKKLSQEEQQSLTTENTSAAIAVSATLDEAKSKVAKRNVRALKPILDGPNSMEMFQLPVIKGDIDSIGSNIVQDLSKIYSEKSKFGSGGESNLDSDYIMPPTAATRKGGNKTDGKTIINSSDIENPRSNSTELESVTLAVTEPVKSSSIREYTMGVTYNTSGSTEVRDLATGQHYWSHHPTGAFRDDRLHEGPQPIMGITAGGPGSGMGDMDITFLGTASCIPSLTRGVSCLAYRCKSDVWLFDCGEGSQQQMQKSRIKPSKINKIFITHLHGDHSFGLPGVLCLIGQSTMAEREKEKLLKKIDQNNNNNIDRFDNSKFDDDFVMDIYGPEGTRDFLRAAIQLTYSKVVNPYRIHELKNVPDLYHKNPKYRPPLPQVKNFDSPVSG